METILFCIAFFLTTPTLTGALNKKEGSTIRPAFHYYVPMTAPTNQPFLYANKTGSDDEELNRNLFIINVDGKLNFKVTLSKEIICQNIFFQTLIDHFSHGYFATSEPMCPRTKCEFILVGHGGVGVLHYTLEFLVYPDTPTECQEVFKATPRGSKVSCRLSEWERKYCSGVPSYFELRYELTGPGKDSFLLLNNGMLYTKPSQPPTNDNVTLLVWRDVPSWVPKVTTSISVMYTEDVADLKPSVYLEARGMLALIGGTCVFVCSHNLGQDTEMFFLMRSKDSNQTIELKKVKNKQTVTLRQVNPGDSTYYSCRAKEFSGDKYYYSTEIYLSVKEDPRFLTPRELVFPITFTDYFEYFQIASGDTAARLFFEAVARYKSNQAVEMQIHNTDVKGATGTFNLLLSTTIVGELNENVESFLNTDYPGSFFDAKKYLSGSLLSTDSPQKTIIEGTTQTLICSFQYCKEHRSYLSFTWRLNGLVINNDTLGSPFLITTDMAAPSTLLLCTVETTSLNLRIVKFKAEYLGEYECEMNIAFYGRILPWIVNHQFEIKDIIPLPRASLYPKSVHTVPGSVVTFHCEAIGQIVTISMERHNTDGGGDGAKVIKYKEIQDNGLLQRVDVNISVVESSDVFCTVSNAQGNGKSHALIIANSTLPGDQMCAQNTDAAGIAWPTSPPRNEIIMPCPSGYIGSVTRVCNEVGVWKNPSLTQCLRKDLVAVKEKIDVMKEGLAQPTGSVVDSIASTISNSMAKTQPKLSGDVTNIVDMMSTLSHAVKTAEENGTSGESSGIMVGTSSLENFVNITNELLSTDTSVWTSLEEGKEKSDDKIDKKDASDDDDGKDKQKEVPVKTSQKLLAAMDSLTQSSLKDWRINEKPIVKQNLGKMAITRKRLQTIDDIHFPASSDESYYTQHEQWVLNTEARAFLPAEAFSLHSKGTEIRYAVILYKNIEKLLGLSGDHTLEDPNKEQVGSEILSFSLNVDYKRLSSDIQLQFQVKNNTESVRCAYLDTNSDSDMVWSSNNCRTELNETGYVRCFCNHFTNFAVLVNPDAEQRKALSIISSMGCSLSIACLVITLVVYSVLWRHVRGEQSVLHVCLSGDLIVVYLLFLLGIDKTENATGCLIITGCLHYCLLLVFSVMMAEGIELYLRIVKVFARKSFGWKLFTPTFSIPLIVVAVTAGVTWDSGYRSRDFCWLGVESGALWTWIGPAVLVIVNNLVIALLVMRAMLSTHSMMNQESKDRARAVVKAIGVLTPLLGFTWFFGILTMFDDTGVFQYFFTVFNTLQGFFIFLFHCLLSKQVRDGFKLKVRVLRAKYASRFSSSSSGQSKLRSVTDSQDMEHIN